MKAILLLLILSISLTIEYQYKFIDDSKETEEEPILQIDIIGMITQFIYNQINTLKTPEFWGNKLKNFISNQIEKKDKRINTPEKYIKAVRECDKKINKENNDEVVKIRKEVGLPLDINKFCKKNPDCGTKIKNDYDYLDVVIYKLPPYNPFSNANDRWTADQPVYPKRPDAIFKRPSNDPKYLADQAKIDKMREIMARMDENLNKCMDNPLIV